MPPVHRSMTSMPAKGVDERPDNFIPYSRNSGREKHKPPAGWTSPALSSLTYSLLNTDDLDANHAPWRAPTCVQALLSRPVLLRPQSGATSLGSPKMPRQKSEVAGTNPNHIMPKVTIQFAWRTYHAARADAHFGFYSNLMKRQVAENAVGDRLRMSAGGAITRTVTPSSQKKMAVWASSPAATYNSRLSRADPGMRSVPPASGIQNNEVADIC